MLEHRVKELSGEVKRTQMLQLERVLTCVSEASKDSQMLTETQHEFKSVNHEITDVTENVGKMWKLRQDKNVATLSWMMPSLQRRKGTRKSGFWGHVWRCGGKT